MKLLSKIADAQDSIKRLLTRIQGVEDDIGINQRKQERRYAELKDPTGDLELNKLEAQEQALKNKLQRLQRMLPQRQKELEALIVQLRTKVIDSVKDQTQSKADEHLQALTEYRSMQAELAAKRIVVSDLNSAHKKLEQHRHKAQQLLTAEILGQLLTDPATILDSNGELRQLFQLAPSLAERINASITTCLTRRSEAEERELNQLRTERKKRREERNREDVLLNNLQSGKQPLSEKLREHRFMRMPREIQRRLVRMFGTEEPQPEVVTTTDG